MHDKEVEKGSAKCEKQYILASYLTEIKLIGMVTDY